MKARTAAALCAAVTVGMLVPVAGCAGGGDGRGNDGKRSVGAGDARDRGPAAGEASGEASGASPGASLGASEEAGDGRRAGRLGGVELAKDEVSGLVIEQAPPGSAGRGTPTADRAACRPLATALGSQPRPRPLESVMSTFAGEQDGPDEGLLGTVRVAEYRPGEAAATLRGLRDAAAGCAGGFTMRTGEGERQVFDAVENVTAPRLGDEAAAYRLTNAVEEAPTLITVVRSGEVLSMFFATSLGDPGRAEIPERLVVAQVGRVEKAGLRPAGAADGKGAGGVGVLPQGDEG
ncbi:hypothetical protein [Streptomyces mobaraensis]|uniref:hypothetical protein n=1 Tax=Streptomyces mobaraensis TaxID=35621 RepID=UPI001CCD3AA1|nr:hypothetical protein [Streptomyces mobaraensis]UBI38288.1 hypothetical protein K7I03_18710 [Streptomyces mobaraensis]